MQTGVIAMTDIPVFTAADGIATLILHEIPARKEGYILVRAVFGSLAGLLRECADFCRGAGAERVYAGGEADFDFGGDGFSGDFAGVGIAAVPGFTK